LAAARVLKAAGYTLHTITKPRGHYCCGRTYLSSGMVPQARTKALELVEALLPFARAGVAVVGLEPSCLLTLRDEALVLGLGEAAEAVSKQALLFEEFVAGEVKAGRFAAKFNPVDAPILLHGHCHQKAFGAVDPILDVLRLIPGARPELIESSCCGMAGTLATLDGSDVTDAVPRSRSDRTVSGRASLGRLTFWSQRIRPRGKQR
jgi:Fe-S oxidoreductase